MEEEQQYNQQNPYSLPIQEVTYTKETLKQIDPKTLSYDEILDIFSKTMFVKPPKVTQQQQRVQPVIAPTPYMIKKQQEKLQSSPEYIEQQKNIPYKYHPLYRPTQVVGQPNKTIMPKSKPSARMGMKF